MNRMNSDTLTFYNSLLFLTPTVACSLSSHTSVIQQTAPLLNCIKNLRLVGEGEKTPIATEKNLQLSGSQP